MDKKNKGGKMNLTKIQKAIKKLEQEKKEREISREWKKDMAELEIKDMLSNLNN